jgi:hypothetical protein
MKWEELVARMREREMRTIFWKGNLKRGDALEHLGIDEQIIRKEILRK